MNSTPSSVRRDCRHNIFFRCMCQTQMLSLLAPLGHQSLLLRPPRPKEFAKQICEDPKIGVKCPINISRPEEQGA